MTTASEDWRRVGAYLAARREQLGYRKRAPWARHVERRGFRSRVITDLELGERDNYSDDTLAIAEEVYQLAPGSIRHAASAGGTPRPVEDTEEAEPEVTTDERFALERTTHRGRVLEIVTDLEADTEDLPDEVAEELVRRSVEHMAAQARLMMETERRRWERQQEQPET